MSRVCCATCTVTRFNSQPDIFDHFASINRFDLIMQGFYLHVTSRIHRLGNFGALDTANRLVIGSEAIRQPVTIPCPLPLLRLWPILKSTHMR